MELLNNCNYFDDEAIILTTWDHRQNNRHYFDDEGVVKIIASKYLIILTTKVS